MVSPAEVSVPVKPGTLKVDACETEGCPCSVMFIHWPVMVVTDRAAISPIEAHEVDALIDALMVVKQAVRRKLEGQAARGDAKAEAELDRLAGRLAS